MSICELDDTNYCERHKKIHKGRELELSQMETKEGEKYRLYWDAKLASPGILWKGINFTRSAVKHILHGLPTVSEEEYRIRLSICDVCEFCNKDVERWECLKCGCYLKDGSVMQGKARWSEESCPKGFWNDPTRRHVSIKKEYDEDSIKKCCGRLPKEA